MKKKKYSRNHMKRAQPERVPSKPSRAVRIAVIVASLVAVVLVAWRFYDSVGAPSHQSLVGRWARTDGTYQIAVTNVTEGGVVDAAYYNPRPIHVAQARASKEGATVNLFIELRDVGYPGSTYNLRYSAEHDALVGVYSQAALHQEFQVVFVRVK